MPTDQRDAILARIREALTQPSQPPGAHGGQAPPAPTRLPSAADHRRVLPAVPADAAGQIALFARHAADLRAEFQVLPNLDELVVVLRQLAATEGWTRIASHAGALTNPVCAALGLPVLRTDQPFDARELEQCLVGLSECDALVAQTGSVLVSTRSAGGRALSVLPPHHVVLARAGQLVPDLPTAFADLRARYGDDFPSMISLITGPSRTGDIERILVLGAHGPKRLSILCVENGG